MISRIIFVLFVLISQFVLQEAFADQAPAGDNAQNKNGEQKSVDDKAMKIFLDKIEIYGRIAKPQTVFIIPGTDPRVNGIRIERRFFSDMFRQVEKSTLRKERLQEQRNNDHILW